MKPADNPTDIVSSTCVSTLLYWDNPQLHLMKGLGSRRKKDFSGYVAELRRGTVVIGVI